MPYLIIAAAVFVILWVLILIDVKRTKTHLHEEGWRPHAGGMVKRLWRKSPVIEEHELESFHVLEDQNN